MKTKNMLLILAILGSTSFANAQDKIHTTAKLPEDSLIWPLDENNTPIEIECTFLSETSLFRVTQGNWEKTEKLVVYNVTKVTRGSYPHKQIIFVCNERWPTKESGIMLKALEWPFRKGAKTFYLKKDGDCRTEDYFNITAYSK